MGDTQLGETSAMPRGTPLPGALAGSPVTDNRGDLSSGFGSKIKLFLNRCIFWPYARASWQYDIICAVILAFIFLTPRSFFEDRPTLGLSDVRHVQGVIEVGRYRDGWHYLIDVRLIESMSSMSAEEAINEVLRRRLRKPFTFVKPPEPYRDKNGVILGYSVVVLQ